MDTTKIKAIIIAILATFAALYLGITAATAQFETIAWVIGGLTLVSCLLMGRNIWLLIPFLGTVDLTLRVPGQPNSILLAQVLVVGFSVLLLTIRKLPYRFRFTEIEFWLVLIALMAVQAYARNPVGLNIFGGSTVGGKYYFTFALAWIASMLISGLTIDPKKAKTAIKLSILGGLINLFVNIAAIFVPMVGYYTGINYANTGGQSAAANGGMVDTGRAGRISGFSQFSNNLALWIGSFRSPLLSLFHPFWGFLILLSGAAAAMSGFRTAVATTGIIYLICLFYRGRLPQVLIATLMAITAVILLALANSIAPLPPNVQRALTFLPGTWDQRYTDDAEGSTDWRMEIWKEVLGTDRWIQNKILGDGLGFTNRELQYQLALNETKTNRIGVSGFDAAREGVLATGAYHSIFVSSVRTCGYAGAVIFILAIIRTCLRAHRIIMRARGTEWFSVTLFFGVPILLSLVWFPFHTFTFLQAASLFLYQASMLRLLENNLPLPVKNPATHVPMLAQRGSIRNSSHTAGGLPGA